MPSTTAQLHSIADYVSRWGSSSSIALFDPKCEYFTTPDIEGVIGYRKDHGCIVVLGDPLCSSKDLPAFIEKFQQYVHSAGHSLIYAAVSQPFADWSMRRDCRALIEVGDELILDPLIYTHKGGEGRLVRQKASQATRAGVTVREYVGQDPEIEKAIEEVGQAWVNARQGPQIYLADVHLFCTRVGRRWFYAESNGKIIGVLLLNRLEKREGWLVNLVLVNSEAPNGTTELLVMSVLDALAAEKCRFLSIGMLTADALREISGLGKVATWVARTCYKAAIKIFGLDKRRKYWGKFKPRSEPSYLIFYQPHIGHKELCGLMNALNVGF